jgi:hypothetical protein
MGSVKAQQELDPLLVGHPDVARVPQLVPRPPMTAEGLVEGAETLDCLLGVVLRLADCPIVSGIERYHLLDTDWSSYLEYYGERLLGIVLQ